MGQNFQAGLPPILNIRINHIVTLTKFLRQPCLFNTLRLQDFLYSIHKEHFQFLRQCSIFISLNEIFFCVANWIYIAGVFNHLDNNQGQWLDNDPHIWTKPFTWGICRPDLRKFVQPDNYVFFILPKSSPHPQMIFAYIRIKEIISHDAAFKEARLNAKRMRNGADPNGNILVDGNGCYNSADGNAHRDRFSWIKQRYAIGYINQSKRISISKIRDRSEYFIEFLNDLFNFQGDQRKDSVVSIITRKGRKLSDDQVRRILKWLS